MNQCVTAADSLKPVGGLNGYLENCDALSNSVQSWAIGMAAVEGGITGAAGVIGLSVDIPAIITLALRTTHKVGLCYGYECRSEMDEKFVFGVLSASSANSIQEKAAALATLQAIKIAVAKQTWKAISQKAASQQFSKESAIIATKNLAKQLGVNITKRKAAQAIPVIGGAVGASVNGWYIKDVARAARRSFQRRWLEDNGKLYD